jgi:hypothetical protein
LTAPEQGLRSTQRKATMTERQSIALILLADEKPDFAIDIESWRLEDYAIVIVASRECQPKVPFGCTAHLLTR